MAKKRPMPVQMPKPESMVIVIPANTKVATGHRPHQTGSGTHGDRRLKRQNTRQRQFNHAVSGW